MIIYFITFWWFWMVRDDVYHFFSDRKEIKQMRKAMAEYESSGV